MITRDDYSAFTRDRPHLASTAVSEKYLWAHVAHVLWTYEINRVWFEQLIIDFAFCLTKPGVKQKAGYLMDFRFKHQIDSKNVYTETRPTPKHIKIVQSKQAKMSKRALSLFEMSCLTCGQSDLLEMFTIKLALSTVAPRSRSSLKIHLLLANDDLSQ